MIKYLISWFIGVCLGFICFNLNGCIAECLRPKAPALVLDTAHTVENLLLRGAEDWEMQLKHVGESVGEALLFCVVEAAFRAWSTPPTTTGATFDPRTPGAIARARLYIARHGVNRHVAQVPYAFPGELLCAVVPSH